jgi:hypothetical protein
MHRPPSSIKHNHLHFNDAHGPKDAPNNVGIKQYLIGHNH